MGCGDMRRKGNPGRLHREIPLAVGQHDHASDDVLPIKGNFTTYSGERCIAMSMLRDVEGVPTGRPE